MTSRYHTPTCFQLCAKFCLPFPAGLKASLDHVWKAFSLLTDAVPYIFFGGPMGYRTHFMEGACRCETWHTPGVVFWFWKSQEAKLRHSYEEHTHFNRYFIDFLFFTSISSHVFQSLKDVMELWNTIASDGHSIYTSHPQALRGHRWPLEPSRLV